MSKIYRDVKLIQNFVLIRCQLSPRIYWFVLKLVYKVHITIVAS